MKLTASPFDPQTGELLPVYRDAYLRGDLSKSSARAVEAYLRRDGDEAYLTLTRWHEFQTEEEPTEAAPSWVRKQVLHIQAQPQRFRRRAASLVMGATLVGGMVFAGTNSLPATSTAMEGASADVVLTPESEAAAAAMRVVTVQGRILDENGKPIAGATVMPKGSRYGTCTNASGTYVLRVPVGEQTLLYGYGGYQDQEVQVSGNTTTTVSLKPHALAKKRWWQIF